MWTLICKFYDYVYKRKATGVYKTAANLYAYDDILDVSDIQRMILKRFDNLKALIGKDGTDGRSDSTLVRQSNYFRAK